MGIVRRGSSESSDWHDAGCKHGAWILRMDGDRGCGIAANGNARRRDE